MIERKVVEAVSLPIGPFNPTGRDTSKRKSPKRIIKCPICGKEMSRESFHGICLGCGQPLVDPAGTGITIIT